MSEEIPDQVYDADSPVEQIPGLGPIRTRALRKAGLSTFGDVAAVSVEQLAEVRGITLIKATQIKEYFAGLETCAAPEPAPVTPPEPVKSPAPPVKAPTAELHRYVFNDPPKPKKTTIDVTPVRTRIQETGAAADAMLRSEISRSFEVSFARQLSRLVSLADRIPAKIKLTAKELDASLLALDQIQSTLRQAVDGKAPGHKKQVKLSETLKEHRRKLQDILKTDD